MPQSVRAFELSLTLAGESVPALLLLPDSAHPVPAALLLHGYSSSKERLSSTIGRALAARGIASLALDLPLHGTRDDALVAQARSNPLGLVSQWKRALAEAKAAVRWLADHGNIDGNRIATVGYSLGSYIALLTAAGEPLVRAVVAAAGGDLPDSPWTDLMRRVADPVAAARRLNGRPLLMLHGRHDRTITAAQAQRLFDAAAQPKELVWYDCGHVLPAPAADRAAIWLAEALSG
jgi:uncharacterized protein